MEIQIRQADLSDLDLLVQWRMEVLREVFSSPQNPSPESLAEENRDYYQWALSCGAHIACFAHAGREIVGCGGVCLYREMPSPDNPNGRCAYLMNIYCRPAFRRHGVGETVVRWLAAQVRAQKISKIYLETSEAGRRLYEHLGFTDMKDMLLLPKGNGPIPCSTKRPVIH